MNTIPCKTSLVYNFKMLLFTLLTLPILSFDDWISQNSEWVWDALHEAWIKADFYVIWKNIQTDEQIRIARKLHSQWHRICNHTYSHRDQTKLSPNEALKDVALASLYIYRAVWEAPKCFRPPYGKKNFWVERAARLLKMDMEWSLAPWVFDTMDWRSDVDPVDRMKKHLDSNVKEILMHDNQDVVRKEVEYIISIIQ